jgi:hypothetical protein
MSRLIGLGALFMGGLRDEKRVRTYSRAVISGGRGDSFTSEALVLAGATF